MSNGRPSGGRGEFEFVPADSLLEREISVDFEALKLHIPAEVRGVHAQGKPRLRKKDPDNRQKLHLPQLVMAVAGLPQPAREDKGGPPQFPLENKQFVMDQMDFEIIEDDGLLAVLAPLRVSVLHSDFQIDLKDRLVGIATDWDKPDRIREYNAELAGAIEDHKLEVQQEVNSGSIRRRADKITSLKSSLFGHTNAGSASTLIDTSYKPEVETEEIVGKEGKLLARFHIYKERDRRFARMVRRHYKSHSGGKLICQACGCVPVKTYGPNGKSCVEAHHKIPIEQLQPDSVTVVSEMAMLCANCHRVVHSKRPCLTVEQVNQLVTAHRQS